MQEEKMNLKIQPDTSLEDFIAPKLGGSTLTLRRISDSELYIDYDAVIQIHLKIDNRAKKVTEELFSPKWERKITVQQIQGHEFLELQAEEDLQKENYEEIAEDILLALDLVGSWAKANKLNVVNQGVETVTSSSFTETQESKDTKDAKPKKGKKKK